MSGSGLKIAALYGLKPHLLGFCGPREKSKTRVILDYLSGQKISEKKIRKIFEKFEGAFAYYKLIAKSNKIKDPFAESVVKAYWIGNELLEKVSSQALKETIAKEFSKPGLLSKKEAERRAKKVPPGSKPHHSFHVLVIGSVTGRIVLKERLFDLCRVSWGKITKLNSSKNRIRVKYRPLLIKDGYHLGKLKEKDIAWNKNILPNPKIGSTVSFHWNLAIQILTQKETKNLQKYTQNTLKTLNSKL